MNSRDKSATRLQTVQKLKLKIDGEFSTTYHTVHQMG